MIIKPCLFVLEVTSHTHKHTCTKGVGVSYARPERPTIETSRVEAWWVLGRGSSLVAPPDQLRVWRALGGSCEPPDLWAFIYLSEFDWPLGRPSRHCFEWFLVFRPPDIVCRRIYFTIVSSFLFFSPPTLRGR